MADSTTNPNATIVDELVAVLRLDATDYEKSDKVIRDHLNKTEKAFVASDKADKRRAEEKKKRLAEGSKQIRNYGESLTKLAGIAGAVLGVGGGAVGFIGMLAALSSTESAMSRATVATGMSVRQLNAWRGTMQAVTGDAEGGANAITGLARELTVGRLTGNMATVQAFASIGVNYKEGEALDAFLGRAQQTYHAAAPGQQQNIEAVLAARGVDANLIRLISSNQNISATYGNKFASSADMNEAGVAAFNSALADFKNNLRNTATTIMSIVTPAIQAFGQWMNEVNPQVAQFADDLKAAGGGIDGFIKVIDARAPVLGTILHDLGASLTIFGQVVDVAVFGLQILAKALGAAYDWINDKLGRFLNLKDAGGNGNALDRIGQFLKGIWGNTVDVARTYGAAPVASLTGASANPYGATLPAGANAQMAGLGFPAHGSSASSPLNASLAPGESIVSAPLPRARLSDRAMQFMNQVIALGFSPEQAAALTANAKNESDLGTNMLSPSGGAAGLFQWMHGRRDAFRKQIGIDPSQATFAQAFQFMMSNPRELRLLRNSFSGGGSAAELGEHFSKVFEAHGKTAEDANRGRIAQQMYNEYMKQTGGQLPDGVAGAAPINLNGPMTVIANDPRQLANGIQRAAGVQSYSSGVR